MLTKVGRANPMLICTDCGLPMDQRETASLSRKRLLVAFSLMVMALLGGALISLATLNEARRAGLLEGGGAERRGEATAEAAKEDKSLLEPSSVLDTPGGAGSLKPPGE